MIYNIPFFAVIILTLIGLYAILYRKNLIKIVIGVSILGSAVNLFLIMLGYRQGGVAPIYTYAPSETMVLPVPQALTLTSIVIAVAVLALMLSLVMHLYRHYKTLDVRKLSRREDE